MAIGAFGRNDEGKERRASTADWRRGIRPLVPTSAPRTESSAMIHAGDFSYRLDIELEVPEVFDFLMDDAMRSAVTINAPAHLDASEHRHGRITQENGCQHALQFAFLG